MGTLKNGCNMLLFVLNIVLKETPVNTTTLGSDKNGCYKQSIVLTDGFCVVKH